ncbi:Zinc knuckle CX2CX4HX4C [Sesbania bispinosa]|nr:Zinc knuckle CX2CX4HX4C [Sesbania bispinosa]
MTDNRTYQEECSQSGNNNTNEEEDPPIILFDDEDIDTGVNSCSRSLVGKIITDKPIHTNSLHNALSGIWCHPKGFRVEEISTKIFQFFFDNEQESNRILRGSPWLFRNSWLVLQPWKRGVIAEDQQFLTVPVHVQIWGLPPPHCKTLKMGQKIGACLGKVLSSELFEVRDRGSFIKMLVSLDTTRPLKVGVHTGNKSDEVFWVDFQYEKLPQFCYSCGLIGHAEEFCLNNKPPEGEKENKVNPLGPWLRTSLTGRRLHIHSEEGTPEVLHMFSSLSVNKVGHKGGKNSIDDKENCSHLTPATPTDVVASTPGANSP